MLRQWLITQLDRRANRGYEEILYYKEGFVDFTKHTTWELVLIYLNLL